MAFRGSKLEKIICGFFGHEYTFWDGRDGTECHWCEFKKSHPN